MRIVAENSPKELAQKLAVREIRWPLRNLASNLMRVVRGAGRPHDVGRECVAVIEAFQEYRDAVGASPSSDEIQQALSIRDSDEIRMSMDGVNWAENSIVSGSLQIAASRLVNQRAQQSAGERELHEGIREMQRAWDAIRAEANLARRKPVRSRRPTK